MSREGVIAADLVRHFPAVGGGSVKAVDGVSFTVARGEVYGLLGSNGAGKSTVMRMLSTLTVPTSGTAQVAGHDVVGDPVGVRASLGYLSASSGLPSRVSCREILEVFAGLQRLADVRGAAERAIQAFGIAEFSEQRVETLSTGMRQRVRIAAAGIHDPAVLILDEPTAGLDLVAANRLLDLILTFRQRGTTVLFSTHILREAQRICDRIGIIDRGVLVAEGTQDALIAQSGEATFEDAFLEMLQR